MRIFLFAEKYYYEIVQERFLIAEHIDGVDLPLCGEITKKKFGKRFYQCILTI